VFNFFSAKEIESNAYSKFLRDNREYYGTFEKGLILLNINDFLKASELITFNDSLTLTGLHNMVK